MAFDEEAAERWYQSRIGQRHMPVQGEDPSVRLRNTQRSFWEKGYAGGPLRGGVYERRTEWAGGGMGGRLGDDWRQIKPIDVDRHGSGLDPYSYALVKGVKRGVGAMGKRSAMRRVMKDQTAKGESAEWIANMRERVATEGAPAEEPAAAPVPEAPGRPKRVMSQEQRDRSNTRRRDLAAQRRDAVKMLAAYSLQDESPEGPMWGGSSTATETEPPPGG